MTNEERAALIADLRGIVENRTKLAEDVKSIISEEVGKAVTKALGERARSPMESFLTEADLRGPGDLPPGAESPISRRAPGMEYVVGVPPQTPVLRALKQPLFVLPHEVEDMRATIEQQVIKYAETGVWPAWTQDLTAAVAEERSRTLAALKEHGADSKDIRLPQGRARRISSTEAFSCRVACNVSEMHAPVRLKVMMQDTLYACL